MTSLMDKKMFEKVAVRIDSYKDEMIELQKKLIATPVFCPEYDGDGELEKANIVEPLAKEIFDSVEVLKALDDRVSAKYRPNIIAKMEGKSDERSIWIMSHLDVVPAGDESKWKTPPYEATIKDGKIYGRGAEDNNQAIVSTIFAAKALKEEGIKPSTSLEVLFVSDEEVGHKHGVEYILQNHKDLFGPNDLVIVPDGGSVDGSAIETADKSMVWFKITITGKESHGAFPDKGINAHRAGAHLVCRMDELQKKLTDHNHIFKPPVSTIEPTMIEKNVESINVVPGKHVVCFDCRLLPSVDCDKFIKAVEDIIGGIEKEYKVKIKYETPQKFIAPKPTSGDSPLVAMLSNSVKDIYKVKPEIKGLGGTVAASFRREGFDAVVYSRMDETLHGPNEYCIIDNMTGDAKIWAHLLMQ